MATLTNEAAKHVHLEIFCMKNGGYVVGQGRWDSEGRDMQHNWREHLAAFTTLHEAVAWVKSQMENRPSKGN